MLPTGVAEKGGQVSCPGKEAKLLADGAVNGLLDGGISVCIQGKHTGVVDFPRHWGQLLGLGCETLQVMWSMQTAWLLHSRCTQDGEKPKQKRSQLTPRTEARATQTCVGAADCERLEEEHSIAHVTQ